MLSLIGVYGVLSFAVGQRTHEIGIRMSLGAGRGSVLQLVVGRGMRLVGLGLAIGLAAAMGLTRFMQSLLHDVSATDPLTYIAVALLLAGVAALACTIPTARAARVDPMISLRSE